MGIICDTCGRDIDALGQDNMGVDAPLCEDCWGEQQSHTVAVPRREASNLRFENALLREKLDAGTEETAVQNLRKGIETAYEASRERALALTKLDECELWLGRCEPKETAAPTLGGADARRRGTGGGHALPQGRRGARFRDARRERGGEGRGNGRGAGQEPARGHEAGHADGGGVAMEQQTEKPKRRPSIEVRCPKCGMREIWHHLPKGGDRCRWCGHLFEDFTYRKVGPSAKEGAR